MTKEIKLEDREMIPRTFLFYIKNSSINLYQSEKDLEDYFKSEYHKVNKRMNKKLYKSFVDKFNIEKYTYYGKLVGYLVK